MLWTFGCSHTQGHGLPDCIDEKGDPIPDVMSQYAWPQQLSNELVEPVTNISFSGIGVRAVWNNILNNYEKFQQNDTVIIMWPCWESRIDVIGDPENPNYHACNIIPIRTYDQNQEEYFINYYSKYHMWLIVFNANSGGVKACSIAVYRLIGYATTADDTFGSSTYTDSVSLTAAAANSAILYAICSSADDVTFSYSGLTLDFNAAINTANTWSHFSATGIASGAGTYTQSGGGVGTSESAGVVIQPA